MGEKRKTACDGPVGRGPACPPKPRRRGTPRRSSYKPFSAYNISLDVYPPLLKHGWADRASSAATNHALQLGATDLEYEVTRVKSPVLGRDMNPLGRGDGTYYAQGAFAIFDAKPAWTGEITTGWGNSICNGDAVPTALDLGGSPSAGAYNAGSGECCPGSGKSDAKDDTSPPALCEDRTWTHDGIRTVRTVISRDACHQLQKEIEEGKHKVVRFHACGYTVDHCWIGCTCYTDCCIQQRGCPEAKPRFTHHYTGPRGSSGGTVPTREGLRNHSPAMSESGSGIQPMLGVAMPRPGQAISGLYWYSSIPSLVFLTQPTVQGASSKDEKKKQCEGLPLYHGWPRFIKCPEDATKVCWYSGFIRWTCCCVPKKPKPKDWAEEARKWLECVQRNLGKPPKQIAAICGAKGLADLLKLCEHLEAIGGFKSQAFVDCCNEIKSAGAVGILGGGLDARRAWGHLVGQLPGIITCCLEGLAEELTGISDPTEQ